jgi:hypothetical protein
MWTVGGLTDVAGMVSGWGTGLAAAMDPMQWGGGRAPPPPAARSAPSPAGDPTSTSPAATAGGPPPPLSSRGAPSPAATTAANPGPRVPDPPVVPLSLRLPPGRLLPVGLHIGGTNVRVAVRRAPTGGGASASASSKASVVVDSGEIPHVYVVAPGGGDVLAWGKDARTLLREDADGGLPWVSGGMVLQALAGRYTDSGMPPVRALGEVDTVARSGDEGRLRAGGAATLLASASELLLPVVGEAYGRVRKWMADAFDTPAAVIVVPANCGIAEREAIAAAAGAVGFVVLGVVSDGVAAAVHAAATARRTGHAVALDVGATHAAAVAMHVEAPGGSASTAAAAAAGGAGAGSSGGGGGGGGTCTVRVLGCACAGQAGGKAATLAVASHLAGLLDIDVVEASAPWQAAVAEVDAARKRLSVAGMVETEADLGVLGYGPVPLSRDVLVSAGASVAARVAGAVDAAVTASGVHATGFTQLYVSGGGGKSPLVDAALTHTSLAAVAAARTPTCEDDSVLGGATLAASIVAGSAGAPAAAPVALRAVLPCDVTVVLGMSPGVATAAAGAGAGSGEGSTFRLASQGAPLPLVRHATVLLPPGGLGAAVGASHQWEVRTSLWDAADGERGVPDATRACTRAAARGPWPAGLVAAKPAALRFTLSVDALGGVTLDCCPTAAPAPAATAGPATLRKAPSNNDRDAELTRARATAPGGAAGLEAVASAVGSAVGWFADSVASVGAAMAGGGGGAFTLLRMPQRTLPAVG